MYNINRKRKKGLPHGFFAKLPPFTGIIAQKEAMGKGSGALSVKW